jgi:cellulose biosynthesis protein BcsQ
MSTRKLTGPAHILAICARKGGVGKSTITWNLGAELAMRGYAVCMLEIEDSPRLKRISIGEERHAKKLDDRLTTHRLFTHPDEGLGASQFEINISALSAEIGVVTHRPELADLEDLKDEITGPDLLDLLARRGWLSPAQSLRFVPGTESLERLDNQYALAQMSESDPDFDAYSQLHRAISHFNRDFDFILMDTPPSLNIVQTNAALAAGQILLVLTFDADAILDYDAMTSFVSKTNFTAAQLGVPRTQILGVVYNMFKASGRGSHLHKRIYDRYTKPYVDVDGALKDPQVSHRQVACIPFESDYLDAAMLVRRPMCVYAPTSPLGVSFYLLAHHVELAFGLKTPSALN